MIYYYITVYTIISVFTPDVSLYLYADDLDLAQVQRPAQAAGQQRPADERGREGAAHQEDAQAKQDEDLYRSIIGVYNSYLHYV